VTRPLEGKVVLVTRARERAGELSARLRERGAAPLEAPAIEIEPVGPGGPLQTAIRDTAMRGFVWVLFTSAAGVDAWFEQAAQLGFDARDLNARVAAVGAGTGEALRAHGVDPELVPDTYTTEALGEAFPQGTGKALLPRADIAPEGLEEDLAAKGWEPLRVDAYRSHPASELPEGVREALASGEVDAVTFTSASTVEGFVALAGPVERPAVVCIGPVTAEAARGAGLKVAAVADPHTLDGLVDAVERALGRA
jgi:uroporphyrinogen III methyltransferase/synthase